MRFIKSSVFSVAATVAATFAAAVALSAAADAQNSTNDFPWRAKSKSSVGRSAAAKTIAAKSSFAAPVKTLHQEVEASFATPARDAQTVNAISTPTPTVVQSGLPEVIYDEGKKYIRQGDTYIESSMLNGGAASVETLSPQITNGGKVSLFDKAKGLTGRLNPFFKSDRNSSFYKSKDWEVPSFSQKLSSFGNTNDDPITFASVSSLPAKTAQPSSIDATKSIYGDKANGPKIELPTRNSQFTSALPTETSITPAVAKLLGGASTPAAASAVASKSKSFSVPAIASKKLLSKTVASKLPETLTKPAVVTKPVALTKPAVKLPALASVPAVARKPAGFTAITSNGLLSTEVANKLPTAFAKPPTLTKPATFKSASLGKLPASASVPAVTRKPVETFAPNIITSKPTSQFAAKSLPQPALSAAKEQAFSVFENANSAPERSASLSAGNDFWLPVR